MKVVLLSYDDYANLAFDQAESLKSIGIDAESFKLIPHPFAYDKQSQVITREQMIREAEAAQTIVVMHSDLTISGMVKEMTKKNIAVYHTGSAYRGNPKVYNDEFNPYTFVTLTDQCEFMKLGAKNIEYNAAAIDVKSKLKFGHQVKRPYSFAHYPSNPEVKGTEEIKKMMLEAGINPEKAFFKCSSERVSHSEQLKRMDDCDIYIELFKPELRGKPYGCYGVTAFEAAAAGKIVITNNIHEEVYENAYGECALQIANTKEKFIQTVKNLSELEDHMISALQTETYRWILRNHSYEANGIKMKNLLEI